MHIIRGDNFIKIECDGNVIKCSTGRYMEADMRKHRYI